MYCDSSEAQSGIRVVDTSGSPVVPQLYHCVDKLSSVGDRPAHRIVIAQQIILLICANKIRTVSCLVEPRKDTKHLLSEVSPRKLGVRNVVEQAFNEIRRSDTFSN